MTTQDLLDALESSLRCPVQQPPRVPRGYIAPHIARAFVDALDRTDMGLSERAAAEDVAERHGLSDEEIDEVAARLIAAELIYMRRWRAARVALEVGL